MKSRIYKGKFGNVPIDVYVNEENNDVVITNQRNTPEELRISAIVYGSAERIDKVSYKKKGETFK